jgi:hypothetical protein
VEVINNKKMDPSKYFKQGSSGYVQTAQALSVIDAAEKAGLKDEAARMRSDLEASVIRAKESGWKDFSGFDMQREVISKTLAPQINAMATSSAKAQEEQAKRDQEIYKESKNIEVTANEIYRLGGGVDQPIIDTIDRALLDKDPIGLAASRNLLEQRLSAQRIEQAKQMDPAAIAKQQELETANEQKQRTIALIDKFIDKKGSPKDILKRSTGFGEGVDRFFGKMDFGAGSASDELVAQDELIRGIVTDDVLKTVQLLKPASNTDIEAIKETRPGITTSPDQWAAYLQSMRNVLSKEVDASKIGEQMTPAPTTTPVPAQPDPQEEEKIRNQKRIDAANSVKTLFPSRTPSQ